MVEYSQEELIQRYKELGMCKQCGKHPHMRVFVVCKSCRYDKIIEGVK